MIAVAPGEVPWNDAEKARMQALNGRDVAIDYAFMAEAEKFMRYGQKNVPDDMLAPSRGDYAGAGAGDPQGFCGVAAPAGAVSQPPGACGRGNDCCDSCLKIAGAEETGR